MYVKGYSLLGAHGQVDKALDTKSAGMGSISSAGHVQIEVSRKFHISRCLSTSNNIQRVSGAQI